MESTSSSTLAQAGTPRQPGASGRGRLMIDAPVRAFHWLFALCFAGAWLTAESEHWRDLHVALGYAFGGLLVFRLVYGLIGPGQARLSLLGRRVAGTLDWLRGVRAGHLNPSRAATLGMGLTMLSLLLLAAPLVLSGYLGYTEWLGLEELLEEVHEFIANAVMSLVALHLGLILLLSIQRRRNLALPMLTGRQAGAGPDVAKANRAWLGGLLVAACLGFLGWQIL